MSARSTRRMALRGPAALLLMGLLAGYPAAAVLAAKDGAPGDTAARRRVVSVKDSPGYYPPNDPEASSERIGRRLNAPLVNKPFTGGARSLDDLGRAVCRALHRRDRDSLLGLCITDDEFAQILWREFPQSRPAVGLTWVDAWKILYARLHAGCMHAMRDNEGRYREFLRFEGDTTARYRNFKLHNRLVLVTRNDLGEVERHRWLRSVAERKGRFKIYSTDD